MFQKDIKKRLFVLAFIGLCILSQLNAFIPRMNTLIGKTQPLQMDISDSGAVWMETIPFKLIDDEFKTSFYVNTGTDKLAAYGFDIYFNVSIINAITVEAGYGGF